MAAFFMLIFIKKKSGIAQRERVHLSSEQNT